ncbi:MAG: hypothetical protein EPN72_02940 [Nevskiaceae bacterium]|nr:MAG: hypothetical protein EPN63_13315 [Nevskiaceae bacterium]TBR74267.1 MAG: hypothetical protein EPN72_02940 [Nevskiaceae bacterium]
MGNRKSKLTQQWINAILAVLIVGFAAWLTFNFKTEFDWTAGNRNTLTAASQKLVAALPDPIHFYGFVYAEDVGTHQSITHTVDLYRQFKKNVALTFIDPSRDPQKVKEFDVNQPGQLVVEYQGRHEALDTASEPAISEALERLAHASNTTITFLTGDGERNIDGGKNDGYSSFVAQLRNKGFKVNTLNLALQPTIPASTSVLVIADPKNQMLPQQQAILADYVKHGGSLLWIADTERDPGLAPLAKELGVHWLPGFVVFPNYRELGMGSPGIYLSARYPHNPVTGSFDQITVFPLVRALTYGKNTAAGWHPQPMLETDDKAWSNVDENENPIVFDTAKGDVAGPLTIGLIQTREVGTSPAAADSKVAPAKDDAAKAPAAKAAKDAKPAAQKKQQRVALVGDADFLSNGNVHLLGNGALGTSMVSWLANRDTALSIAIPKAPDHDLYLPGWASWLITAGFVVILPLILILFGTARWVIRRRR